MKFAYDKTTTMAIRLGDALVKAVTEHGAPNSFAFSELVGAKDAMLAGRAVRRHWGAFCRNVHTRLSDDLSVNLSGGRIHVTPRSTPKQ